TLYVPVVPFVMVVISCRGDTVAEKGFRTSRSRGTFVQTAAIIAVALVLIFGVLPLVGMWLMMGSMLRPWATNGFWPPASMMGGWSWLLMVAGFLIVLG